MYFRCKANVEQLGKEGKFIFVDESATGICAVEAQAPVDSHATLFMILPAMNFKQRKAYDKIREELVRVQMGEDVLMGQRALDGGVDIDLEAGGEAMPETNKQEAKQAHIAKLELDLKFREVQVQREEAQNSSTIQRVEEGGGK